MRDRTTNEETFGFGFLVSVSFPVREVDRETNSSVSRASSVSEIVRDKQSAPPKTKDKLCISLQFESYLSMVNLEFYEFVNDVIMIIINVNVVGFYCTNRRK